MISKQTKIFSKAINIYDLYDGSQKEFVHSIEEIISFYKLPFLSGPLTTIIYELSANALNALYKLVFFTYMVKEMGLDSLSQEEWLSMFKTEWESHKSENFSRVCKANNLYITVQFEYSQDFFKIQIENPGLPSTIEKKQLKNSIEKAKTIESLNKRKDKQNIKSDKKQNDSYSGLPMVIRTIKNLGIPISSLSYHFGNNKTTTSLNIKMDYFDSTAFQILTDKDNIFIEKELLGLQLQLDYSYMEFNVKGELIKVSNNFLNIIEEETKNGTFEDKNIVKDKHGNAEKLELINKVIPDKFREDIFLGPSNIHLSGKFENYRIWVKTKKSQKNEILYNVSGYLKNGIVHSLWQKVLIEIEGGRLSEGSILETLQLQKITKRYIPEMVTLKSKEIISHGESELPNEIEIATIFFADISGFTKFSEEKNPLDVLNMLNSTLGVAAKIISRNNGAIDKFMGDAIFALFKKPEHAIRASLEIQTVFKELNEFRELTEELPIHLRIGLHTGSILMGNVGTDHRMDWTAIGDIVNTASRIEKQCDIDKVLVSMETYELVKDKVTSKENLEIKMKGKVKPLLVYYIDSIKYIDDEQTKEISI